MFTDWLNVGPAFRGTVGDPVHRDFRGWCKGTRYVNQTGRNDIFTAKVSHDGKRLDPLVIPFILRISLDVGSAENRAPEA